MSSKSVHAPSHPRGILRRGTWSQFLGGPRGALSEFTHRSPSVVISVSFDVAG